eukprot:403344090
MGNCIAQNTNNKSISQDSIQATTNLAAKNSYEKQYIVGQGGFSKVWKVQSKRHKQHVFALKEMSKAKIIARNTLSQILMEKNILSKLNSSFIVNMHAAFQDRDNLFLVLDYCQGGDLRYQINQKQFNEVEAKFMVACLLEAVEYTHSQGVIHRDIKPENLVFDNNGYLLLTDFGIAREIPTLLQSNTTIDFVDYTSPKQGIIDTSGTPGYMSPEAMCKLPHTFVSDFFAIGVLVYELIMKHRPYNGKTKTELKERILAKQVMIKNYEVPDGWSQASAEFANLLLKRKPQDRLGYHFGVQELKDHPWFIGFDWKKLKTQKMKAPWVPPQGDNFRRIIRDFFDGQFVHNEGDDMDVEEIQKIIMKEEIQRLFKSYQYESNFPLKIQPLNKMTYLTVKEQAMNQSKKKTRNLKNIEKLQKIKPSIIERYEEVVIIEDDGPKTYRFIQNQHGSSSSIITNQQQFKEKEFTSKSQSVLVPSSRMSDSKSFASTQGQTVRKGSYNDSTGSFVSVKCKNSSLSILHKKN